MTEVVHVHHAHTEKEAAHFQSDFFARLEQFGEATVWWMMARDDFAPAMVPLVREWLKGKKKAD